MSAQIKVDDPTKESVQLAADVLGIEEGEFVRRVVDEYYEWVANDNDKPLRERFEARRGGAERL